MSYIYMLGICGTGVGALAGLLKQLGHEVVGSDENVYPPMSDKLREWGIPILNGYNIEHLSRRPDLVVVGNVIRASNPEAIFIREQGIKQMSMPAAIAEFGIGDRHSIVVAGTHGKTTVTALIAHLLLAAGRDPSYLIGGALIGYPESFRITNSKFFVIEGDEYDTAYFDKGPKFVHYRPRTAIITSLEFDHADIFENIAAVEKAFGRLVQTVPEDGHLIVWHGATRARKQLAYAGNRHITVYALHQQDGVNLYLKEYIDSPNGLIFTPVFNGVSLGSMNAPLWGEVSVQNVLAAIAATIDAGLNRDELAHGFATFRGVKRRLELLGEPNGIAVVDDFGHHPTAVRMTLNAAKVRWPNRRLWAVFEPRSATARRNVLQHEYVDAFQDADMVVIASHERMNEIPYAQRFNPQLLVQQIQKKGINARAIALVDEIANTIYKEATRGDVIILFSNGSFGGLHIKVLSDLAARRNK
ncbi:MAG: UDP-N-acetylmuramate dehydrogenase [Deltaproteobacteria bacterium]|nr:UDP-N-acetylmuramate dehydrogenase [Deltaproteobacteria bacterium]